MDILRLRLWLLIVLVPGMTWAQFTDDFNDGDFTNSPTWSGDVAEFEVLNDTLHLNAPAVTEESYLSTPSVAINDAVWEFHWRYDISPSSANQVFVYLVSDQANLEGDLNGYFVRLGNTDDEVSLYRQDGASSTEIIDGKNKTLDSSPVYVRIRVTRDATGNWELFRDTLGGTSFTSEGTAFDDSYISSNYFGVLCDYTSTKSQSFYFDDFIVTGTGFVDTIKPTVISVEYVGDSSVKVVFSEDIDPITGAELTNYSADNNLGFATNTVVTGNEVSLIFAGPFQSGIIYSLYFTNIEDIAGNVIDPKSEIFAKIETPEVGDIVINEIMFNPFGSGSDYLELYNNSNKIFDLAKLKVANVNDDNTLNQVEWASSTFKYFKPGKYIVLTEDSLNITENYTVMHPDYLVEIGDLPSMNNDDGTIAVLDSAENRLDQFSYTEEMHFALYDDVEGISLERINPNATTQDENNWHSAAADANYGTPTFTNSQLNTSVADGTFVLDPDYISPDGDGNNDLLNINYQLDNSGTTVNIIVFDSRGRKVAHIARNTVLGTSGVLRWDGVTDDGTKARKGVYVLFIESFNLNGEVEQYKLAFTVNGRF